MTSSIHCQIGQIITFYSAYDADDHSLVTLPLATLTASSHESENVDHDITALTLH
jgi:hypothetical protein